ncbi:MAG TPA: hypothetical protein EYP22_04075 [Methanosarcinales archaeon]|nr:hypothetical protein [Methanosarcinales archaeon]
MRVCFNRYFLIVLNGNGIVDIGDVTKLAYYLVGKVDSLFFFSCLSFKSIIYFQVSFIVKS